MRIAPRPQSPMPSAGDIAILLQTVVGAWPPGLEPTDRERLAAYAKRIVAWQQKALREATLFSDWSAPNEPYERAARELVAWLLAGPSELLTEIADFAWRIAPAGAVNGLAQVLLKLTAPGVPDIYQGTEYWDFSLIDPDNRTPVDFAARKRTLRKIWRLFRLPSLRLTGPTAASSNRRSPVFSQCERDCLIFSPTVVRAAASGRPIFCARLRVRAHFGQFRRRDRRLSIVYGHFVRGWLFDYPACALERHAHRASPRASGRQALLRADRERDCTERPKVLSRWTNLSLPPCRSRC